MEYHGIKIMGGDFESYGIKFYDLNGTGYMEFQDTSESPIMILENTSHNVGIGTTDATRRLSLARGSSDGVYVSFQNVTTQYTTSDGFLVGIDSDEHALIWNFENKDMSFGVNSDEKMRILANGNVGIGSNNPGNKLDVVGNSLFTGIVTVDGNFDVSDGNYAMTDKVRARDGDGLYLEDDGGNGIFIEDGGQVGIGIAAPTALLHVNGTFRVQNGTDINELSIDGALVGNSDNAVPTEKAVKTYVDTEIGGLQHHDLGGLEDDDHPQYRLKQELISYEDANFTVDSTSFDELKCFVIDSTGPVTVTIDPVSLSEVGYEVELVFWDSTASPRTVTIQASGTDKIGNSSSGGTMYNMVNIPTEEQFSIRLKVVQPGMIAVMAVVGMWNFT